MRHFLSLGLGTQSSALALKCAHGDIAPMPDGAIFADTHGEPDAVYRWREWLTPLLPFPCHEVTRGSLEQAVLSPHVSANGVVYFRTAIPFFTKSKAGKIGRIGHRTCTRDYKLVPIFRKVRELVGQAEMAAWRRRHKAELRDWSAWLKYQRAKRKAEKLNLPFNVTMAFPRSSWDVMQTNALVCQYIGISLDEMGRAKPSREPWIVTRWPLIEQRTTRAGCVQWMREHGYPDPPRSACWYCPFRSNREWRHLRDTEPHSFDKAVEFDRKARELRQNTSTWQSQVYLHRSCKPLDQVDLSTDEENGQLTFGWQEECAGICGV